MKVALITISTLLSGLLICGCATERRDFCECMSLTRALDGLTLSKEEMEAKERGCKWIQDELSTLEQMRRFAQCYAVRTDSVNDHPSQVGSLPDSSISVPETSPSSISNSDDNVNRVTDSMAVDIDGNSYHELDSCSQIWLTQNLNVTRYRNGEIIPEVEDSAQWANLTTGAWCTYSRSRWPHSSDGKLYNWYAVNDPRGLAPAGWHIPTSIEWYKLVDCFGGAQSAGCNLNLGTDTGSGFAIIDAGVRNDFGGFAGYGLIAVWWSSTNTEEGNPLCFASTFDSCKVLSSGGYGPRAGFSVRCIKN